MKKKILLFLCFIVVFFIRLNMVTFKESVTVGQEIDVVGRVDAGKGKVDRIDGKYPRKNIYFLVNKVSDGEKRIVGTVSKIKVTKWGEYYSLTVKKVESRINFMKSYLLSKIKKISENYSIDMENFLRATILGEGYLLDNSFKEKFKYTGTAHILVISGLHIGVIIAGLEFIFIKLRVRKQIREGAILAILSLYVLAVGATPSVIRAYLMGAVYLLSGIFYEKSDGKKSFFISFIISLLLYPNWIFSISFLMSYTAVFSIIFVYMKLPKITLFKNSFLNKVVDLAILSLTIQLCMMPIMIIFFKTVPMFAFISNVVVIPIASLFIILSFTAIFLSNFYLSFLISPILYYVYSFMIFLIDMIAKLPYLSFEI